MDPVDSYTMLSDAGQLAVIGSGLWTVAAVAGLMEWRRSRKRNLARLDEVGWVPWMAIFMLAAVLGAGILALSLPVVLRG